MAFWSLIKNGLRHTGAFLKRNAPKILTGIGIGGSIGAVVLAVKATPKAVKLIEERKEQEDKEKLTVLETVDTCWKVYTPTALTLAAAITCIIGSNFLSLKEQAALLGLYSAQGELLKDYKKQVVETIGPDEERKLRDNVYKKKFEEDPRIKDATPPEIDLFPVIDNYTGQLFYANKTILELKIAEAKNMLHDFHELSLNEWLLSVKERPVSNGYDKGWNDDTGFYVRYQLYEVDGTPGYMLLYDESEPADRYNFANP